MKTAASCQNCCTCIPKEELFNQTDWKFPEEMKCYGKYEFYPDGGHICPEIVPKKV